MRRFLLALLFLLLASPAGAHLPPSEEDLALTRSVAGAFESGDEVFALSLHLEVAMAVPVDVLVPPSDRYEEHRPALLLLGEGTRALAADDVARLPVDAEEGWLTWNQEAERPLVFDVSARRVWWSSGPVALPLAAGDYQLVVWSPEGTPGAFGVGVGVDGDPLREQHVRLGPPVELIR